uniref:Splicing factor PRP45 n=1 Tax=Lotharella vacuolata TaxID=74820 RepID=A0A0H5BHH7_9EUKA|nr:splicing factor PRP45 [Lotharella vacuolata]
MAYNCSYGLRNHKFKFSIFSCKNGGAFPEIHFIQNFQNDSIFFNKKILKKSSTFSFFMYKLKKKSITGKNNNCCHFNSDNLKLYYKKLLNINKKYDNKFFRTNCFSYFTRKLKNNKNQIIKITTNKMDYLVENYIKKVYYSIDITNTHDNGKYIYYKKKNNPLWLPKSVSNWKNPRGFTIPLNIRICNKPDFQSEKNLNTKFLSTSNILDLAESKKLYI